MEQHVQDREQRKSRIIPLHRQGMSFSAISKETGISTRAVRIAVQEWKLKNQMQAPGEKPEAEKGLEQAQKVADDGDAKEASGSKAEENVSNVDQGAQLNSEKPKIQDAAIQNELDQATKQLIKLCCETCNANDMEKLGQALKQEFDAILAQFHQSWRVMKEN